jgi:hypothetical protein
VRDGQRAGEAGDAFDFTAGVTVEVRARVERGVRFVACTVVDAAVELADDGHGRAAAYGRFQRREVD